LTPPAGPIGSLPGALKVSVLPDSTNVIGHDSESWMRSTKDPARSTWPTNWCSTIDVEPPVAGRQIRGLWL
jgi:hypothetical protein